MIKQNIYIYKGTNGSITTPVYLENVPCIKKIKLIADANKLLQNGKTILSTVIVPEDKVSEWKEVDGQ